MHISALDSQASNSAFATFLKSLDWSVETFDLHDNPRSTAKTYYFLWTTLPLWGSQFWPATIVFWIMQKWRSNRITQMQQQKRLPYADNSKPAVSWQVHYAKLQAVKAVALLPWKPQRVLLASLLDRSFCACSKDCPNVLFVSAAQRNGNQAKQEAGQMQMQQAHLTQQSWYWCTKTPLFVKHRHAYVVCRLHWDYLWLAVTGCTAAKIYLCVSSCILESSYLLHSRLVSVLQLLWLNLAESAPMHSLVLQCLAVTGVLRICLQTWVVCEHFTHDCAVG